MRTLLTHLQFVSLLVLPGGCEPLTPAAIYPSIWVEWISSSFALICEVSGEEDYHNNEPERKRDTQTSSIFSTDSVLKFKYPVSRELSLIGSFRFIIVDIFAGPLSG